jgi:hypothetical protein
VNLNTIDLTGVVILILAVGAVLLLLRVAFRLTASLIRLGCLIGVLIVVAYVVLAILDTV